MKTFSALLAYCARNYRSLVNPPYKGQWRGALLFSLICAGWTNDWVNCRDASRMIFASLNIMSVAKIYIFRPGIYSIDFTWCTSPVIIVSRYASYVHFNTWLRAINTLFSWGSKVTINNWVGAISFRNLIQINGSETFSFIINSIFLVWYKLVLCGTENNICNTWGLGTISQVIYELTIEFWWKFCLLEFLL